MELKERANLALGWIFGVLAIFMALPMFFVSFISGLPYLIVALMLLPPAREYTYSITKITLSAKARAIAIVVLIIISMYFSVTSSDKAAMEDAVIEAQEQSANLAAINQKNADYFNQNSASILAQVQKLIDDKRYSEALAASSKYLSSKNVELKKLYDIAIEMDRKEKTESILAEIAKTPESDLNKLAELYAQLVAINPQAAEYKEKHQAILGGIEWNKSKAIVAQGDAKQQDSKAKTDDELKIRIMSSWEGAIKDVLIDSDSAKFRNVYYVIAGGRTSFACGEVNSKNRLGGYTGFKGFITAGLKEYTFLEGETAAFDEWWKQVCVEGMRI